jgi:DNA-binding cell septation regulator SpoVG
MALSFSAKVNLVKNPQGPLRAYATVIIDGLVEINGFRVVEGTKGLFVAAPQTKGTKQTEDGKDQYFDDVRFSDADEKGISETKQKVQQAVLEAYGQAVGNAGRGDTAAARTKDPTPTGKRPGMARTSSW